LLSTHQVAINFAAQSNIPLLLHHLEHLQIAALFLTTILFKLEEGLI
jgi:hypothetical protein